jgi:hypothetical protein
MEGVLTVCTTDVAGPMIERMDLHALVGLSNDATLKAKTDHHP